MDFHGNIDLRNNEAQQVVLTSEADLPLTAATGRLAFSGYKLYMCIAQNGGNPVWIPLTNKIDTYQHTESVASTTWTIEHKLNTTAPLVQVYDISGSMILPDSVTATDESTITITFSVAISGSAIIMEGEKMPNGGAGILEPSLVYNYLLSATLDNPNAYGPAANDYFGASVSVS